MAAAAVDANNMDDALTSSSRASPEPEPEVRLLPDMPCRRLTNVSSSPLSPAE